MKEERVRKVGQGGQGLVVEGGRMMIVNGGEVRVRPPAEIVCRRMGWGS